MSDPLADIGPVALDGFEVWDRDVQAPAGKAKKVAFVSVRVGGVVGINRAAFALLGGPRAVKVMFDPQRRRLGLIPTSVDDPDRYLLDPWGSCGISCRKLFQYYGIQITQSRRYYDLQLVDGILIVDLKGGSEPKDRRW